MGRATDFSNCYIYHIKSMDGVVHYVGSTSNMNSRKSSHKYNCSHENNKNYNLDIYQYIRNNGGFDNFEIIPIRKLENVSNKNDLLIAERTEMEKYTGLKNMRGSYQTNEEHLQQISLWQKNNPEKHNQYSKKYYESNKEYYTEYNRKWREANKEKINEKRRQKYQQKKQLKETDQ